MCNFMKLTDVPADYIIKATKIPKRTFFNRVVAKKVMFVEPYRGQRYYSIKDWNEKNPDYEVPIV